MNCKYTNTVCSMESSIIEYYILVTEGIFQKIYFQRNFAAANNSST